MWLAAAFLLGLASQPAHTWIADLKANRTTLANGEVRVEGDVVDIRSTSPESSRGLYRIIDASDPAGVLVRTDRLPKEGGEMRLRARLAAKQPSDGSLLLEEIERGRTDVRSLMPVALSMLSLASLLILIVLMVRAVVEERRYQVSPPLWLLPDAGPYGKTTTAAAGGGGGSGGGGAVGGSANPSLKYDPDLEDADQLKREGLQRRKRTLLRALLGSMALTLSSTAWVLASRPNAAQVPAFIFIDGNEAPIAAPLAARDSGPDSLRADRAPILWLDSAAGGASRAAGSKLNPPVRNPFTAGAADSAVGGLASKPLPVRVDTVRIVQPALPPPPPPPAAETPPAPEPSPAPRAPARDSTLERMHAEESIADGANRLVAAINGRRQAELAGLVSDAVGNDPDRRDRFFRLVKDFAPRAKLDAVGGTTLADPRAEGRFTITLTWRGDFGVDRRKTGRLVGVVRRLENGWQFEGARLLDAWP